MSIDLRDLVEAQKRVKQRLVELGFARNDRAIEQDETPDQDESQGSKSCSVVEECGDVDHQTAIDIVPDKILVMKRAERMQLRERIKQERHILVVRLSDVEIDAPDHLYPRSLEAEGLVSRIFRAELEMMLLQLLCGSETICHSVQRGHRSL
jgi:hypothetical protein